MVSIAAASLDQSIGSVPQIKLAHRNIINYTKSNG